MAVIILMSGRNEKIIERRHASYGLFIYWSSVRCTWPLHLFANRGAKNFSCLIERALKRPEMRMRFSVGSRDGAFCAFPCFFFFLPLSRSSFIFRRPIVPSRKSRFEDLLNGLSVDSSLSGACERAGPWGRESAICPTKSSEGWAPFVQIADDG